jgi:lactoylglutathione lyase
MNTKLTLSPDSKQSVRAEKFEARTISASLTVKDIQKSMSWYENVLGFTLDRKHEREGKLRGATMKAGQVRILLGQDDGAKGWDRVKGEGFSLYITTDQNIDALAKRAKDFGGILVTEPTDMPWGARIFRLLDPDGFKLVISSVRPE